MSGDVFLQGKMRNVEYSGAACEQQVLTFVSDYLGGLEEETAMLQVHHLPFETILHHIHQSQLITQVLSRGHEWGKMIVEED